ncbi:MAG: hypothetical protein AVDCRST_MAG33-6 [uncultured Thermomicrobiales bacterium]|uniref:Membrane protein NfeD2 N-terminal transmembrane domain-containing protein n=1 Tax=uncultured Thermomicrobiales bacterium TaxID=1645740 RepID=A0A6J4U4P7_9BACT|nr:MAG: hypothetical protein AVDCRST_MAG33-6 [uncultured Thermomicrobiales bacterium]
MFPINDLLDAILLGSFFFGLIFVVFTLMLGAIGGGHGDAGGHGGDAGGHGGDAGSGTGAGHHALDLLGFLNVSTVLAFIGWFGGAGYLVRNGLGWVAPVALVIGLLAGLAGAAAVTWFLRKVIAPADKAMDPRDYELPGTLARVSSSIRVNGTGEIVYEQQGYRQVSAARGLNGAEVRRGVEVVILETRAGIAYVQPWTDLIAESDERAIRESLDDQFRALDAIAPDVPVVRSEPTPMVSDTEPVIDQRRA